MFPHRCPAPSRRLLCKQASNGTRALSFRNINPDNILLTADGFIKVCDFDSCVWKRWGKETVGNLQTPSLEYMSPEVSARVLWSTAVDCKACELRKPPAPWRQLAEYHFPELSGDDALGEQKRQTKSYTPACDVWALGCMVYELITGSPPFPMVEDVSQERGGAFRIPLLFHPKTRRADLRE